jgi:hypothetical protein
MTIFLSLTIIVLIVIHIRELVVRKKFQAIAKGQQEEIKRLISSHETAITDAHSQLDRELLALNTQVEAARHHYESEALKQFQELTEENLTLKSNLKEFQKLHALQQSQRDVQKFLDESLREAEELKSTATNFLEKVKNHCEAEKEKLEQELESMRKEISALLSQAMKDAADILVKAEQEAKEVAGEAFLALRNKNALENAERSIRNVIKGYSDEYIVPNRSVLDNLAQHFSHTAAGTSLMVARDLSRKLVLEGHAAQCDYSETSRRETAIRFVTDAFNGRVDAILSRAKEDNYGLLKAEIEDAFQLVNLNGEAFRKARISPAYLEARLQELRWAVVVQELKSKEREEQRRIKEQIREEEKSRREYERAIRESEREEEMLKKAMQEAHAKLQIASEEQRLKYETQLQSLQQKLIEAEERNQRAISMAQQTRRGHVYIISNIGSFGEDVYKIGVTRRLEPLDRIRELGDASVPFDFDVHALIFSEDAPGLETKLHKSFLEMQINKVNPRKEFFRTPISKIREQLEKDGISCSWTMLAAAAEYRETQAIESRISKDQVSRNRWLNSQEDFSAEISEEQELLHSPPSKSSKCLEATAPFAEIEKQ